MRKQMELWQMEVFLVGGAVRDTLLGHPPKDRDYVVVGATPDDMLENGFTKVGADFPVFLKDGEEYALARQERKVGPGYNGFETHFEPNVTLEDDLVRRDLTINAMAQALDKTSIIDPFGGVEDLKNGVLRHVSEAFAEDPVRVLRVARFRARYNFAVAPETMDLMRELVKAGELDHLTPERVWAELEKAMMEDHPSAFFWTLQECGAMDVLFPEFGRSLLNSGYYLKKAALRKYHFENRVMLLTCMANANDIDVMLKRLKAPTDIIRLCFKFNNLIALVKDCTSSLEGKDVFDLLITLDAYRRSDDFYKIARVSLLVGDDRFQNQVNRLLECFSASKGINFAALPEEARNSLKGPDIGDAINEARLEVIKKIAT